MKIEIQDAYPIFKKDKLLKNTWSVHAYIDFLDMDLRNIYAKRVKKGFLVYLPFVSMTDPVTKKRVKFPIVDFTNKETTKNIIKEISKQLSIYFKNKEK